MINTREMIANVEAPTAVVDTERYGSYHDPDATGLNGFCRMLGGVGGGGGGVVRGVRGLGT